MGKSDLETPKLRGLYGCSGSRQARTPRREKQFPQRHSATRSEVSPASPKFGRILDDRLLLRGDSIVALQRPCAFAVRCRWTANFHNYYHNQLVATEKGPI